LNRGYPSIRKEIFENIIIPLPELKIQREIVTNIYKTIKMENQIEKLREEVQSRFIEATVAIED